MSKGNQARPGEDPRDARIRTLEQRVAELEAQRAPVAVTEAEEALRASEERFRTVIENSRDGINMLDLATGRYVFMSPAQVSLTGFTEEELRNLPVEEAYARVHPDDREISVRQQKEVTAGRELGGPVEYRWKVKSGEYRWFSDSRKLVRDWQGRAVALVGVSRDITDRKRAEEALRASELRLRLLSRTAGELLHAEDPRSIIPLLCQEVMAHLACDAFLAFLADPATRTLGIHAAAGVPEADLRRSAWIEAGQPGHRAVRDGQRLLLAGIQESAEPGLELLRTQGFQAWCCHPLMGQGQALGALSFGTRIRAQFSDDEVELMRIVADQVAAALQRAEAERALAVTNAQLREEDRSKNEFLAVLSHELRNPLAPIASSLYILERAVPGSDQANRARQVIGRQVTQLTKLVDDLLDVTRISRNKVHLQKERLELGELVRRAAEDNRALFERAGVALEFVPASEPVMANADGTRLTQVVGNLLQNAAKFTPTGGHARVSVGAEGAESAIRVSDDGMGIEPRTLSRLFEPFVQADQSLARGKGGLGLGLALVKGLVEMHGGSVSARSEGPGKGSEFAVRLPLVRGAALPARPRRPAPAGPRRRVLVIEDNVDAARSLFDTLELCGHEVTLAYTGPEGLARARELGPEIVFCDIGLPGMDGFEVARAFTTDERLKSIYLVALSGYALPEDVRRAVETGFRRHLAKPVTVDQLEEVLAEAPRSAPRPSPTVSGDRAVMPPVEER